MRIAFDMSSVLWTSLQAGKDVEGIEVEFEDRKVYVNSTAYGYENAINLMVAAIKQFNLNPINAIMVFEGKNSKSRRAMIYPYYKGNRDTRPPEAYEEFNKLKEMVKTAFRNVGAIAVHQDFVEGDDVLAWLAKNTEEDLVIVSNDNDLVVLHGPNEYGAEVICRIGDNIGRNKYGDFDLKLVTLYKALVGDSSDNIKGCPGFGPAAFQAVNARYGDDGCFELLNLISTGQRDEVANIAEEGDCKYLRLIATKWDEVLISHKLVLLRPEWVDTVKLQPEWLGGFAVPEVADERLAKWKGQHRLVTASNYEAACQFMQSKLSESPFVAFDIETFTPPESDDWKALNSVKVDVIGSYLAGFSVTFGANMQYSYYATVAHADSDNVSMSQARKLIEMFASKPTKVQNMNFELPVLYLAQDEDGSLWRDHWKDNGFQGFLPNVNDTKFEASYVCLLYTSPSPRD
jgi:5'-3' exonuclease